MKYENFLKIFRYTILSKYFNKWMDKHLQCFFKNKNVKIYLEDFHLKIFPKILLYLVIG